MKILTAAEMREVDRQTSERFGVPSLQLMENAGTEVAEFLRRALPEITRRRVVFLCGKGNNGGDGLVAARKLKETGANPDVLLFAREDAVEGDAAVNLKRWRATGGDVRSVTSAAEWEAERSRLTRADLIVDALLGTGLKGPVEGLLAQVIADITQAAGRAMVVAVDIPSGICSDEEATGGPAVRADYTITFTAPKIGQLLYPNSEFVGRLMVCTIGSPAELTAADATTKLVWLEPREFATVPLGRRAGGHKGDYGHALLVAGSRGKTGAAILGGWAALRAGAGLVTVATPDVVLPTVAAGLPEIMTEPLLSTDAGTVAAANLDYNRVEALTAGKSVVAIGPGLTTQNETQQYVRAVVGSCELPLVVDADGLNAFAGRSDELARRRGTALCLTPHPGEMARLLGTSAADVQQRRIAVAREAAARWRAFVVLKGHQTLIAAPDGRVFVNSTGNPGMASGGTGDVLTGVLAGLTAQFGTEDWGRVLGLGVYLHGLAGDLAAEDVGEASLMATDLLRFLPAAFRRLEAERGRG